MRTVRVLQCAAARSGLRPHRDSVRNQARVGYLSACMHIKQVACIQSGNLPACKGCSIYWQDGSVDYLLLAIYYLLLTTHFLLLTSYYLLITTYYLLLTTYYLLLLLASYYSLLTSYFSLLTTYYLLLILRVCALTSAAIKRQSVRDMETTNLIAKRGRRSILRITETEGRQQV